MIAGLVLAAGESSRMGQDKALLSYRGRTFLETVLARLREADVSTIAVVLGHHAEEIRSAVNLEGVEVVINPEFRRGQTSSFQAGLRALAGANPEAVMLCLVDQPLVSVETLKKLLETLEASGAAVVIPTFRGERGHPTLISRKLFQDILALGPGEGANTVIRKHREATQLVEVPDPGVLLDIDDPETYRRLQEGLI